MSAKPAAKPASQPAAQALPAAPAGPPAEERGLANLVGVTVSVITNDGRNIVGILRGYDQTTNVVLEECHERVYSSTSGVEQVALGLYLVRGDNIAVVGELDEDLDANLDLTSIRAPPLKTIGN